MLFKGCTDEGELFEHCFVGVAVVGSCSGRSGFGVLVVGAVTVGVLKSMDRLLASCGKG